MPLLICLYRNYGQPWQSIHKIATEQELPDDAIMATIVKVEGMHHCSYTFGPIPYVNYEALPAYMTH